MKGRYNIFIDLHIHTRFSDGVLSYDEIFNLAKENNVKILSITDHDTIIELKNYEAYNKMYNINIIPGLEISSNLKKVHILGYGIQDFDMVEKALIALKLENVERNKETIIKLQKYGVNIDYNSVKSISKKGIITYRDIVEYLYINNYVKDRHEAYRKYIGKGSIAYVPSKEMKIIEILTLINNAGGISVLAHPCTISNDLDELLKKMVNYNLSGIEINKDKITNNQYMQYMKYAYKYGLCLTSGSDFHDPFLSKLGVEVDDNYLDLFQKKLLLRK